MRYVWRLMVTKSPCCLPVLLPVLRNESGILPDRASNFAPSISPQVDVFGTAERITDLRRRARDSRMIPKERVVLLGAR